MRNGLLAHIVDRAGARADAYAFRALPAIIVFPFAFIFLLVSWRNIVSGNTAAVELAALILVICTLYHGVVLFIAIPFITARVIAVEQRERTLPILILACGSVWRMYVIKLGSVLLSILPPLVATIPVVAIGSFYSGVSAVQVVIYILAGLPVVLAGVSICLFGASLAKSPAQAVIGNVMLFALVVGVVVVWNYFSPMLAPLVPWALTDVLTPDGIRINLIIHTVFWIVVAIAAGLLAILLWPLSVRTEGRVTPVRATRRSFISPSVGERIFLHGPQVAWGTGRVGSAWPLFVAVAFVPISLVPGLGTAIVVAVVVFEVCFRADAARGAGEIDSLMITPLTDHDLTKAFYRANLRSDWVFLPAFIAGTAALPLFWGTGNARVVWESIANASNVLQVILAIATILSILFYGIMKYLLAVTIATRVALHEGPMVVRCAAGVAAYLALVVAASSMSGVLPFAFALYEQLAAGAMPGTGAIMVYVLLATPIASLLLLAAVVAVNVEGRSRQPWPRLKNLDA